MRVLIFFVLVRFSPHLIDDDAALLIFSTGVPALAAVELSEGAAARSLQGAPRTPRAPSVVAMVALKGGGEIAGREKKKDKTKASDGARKRGKSGERTKKRDWRPEKRKKKKLNLDLSDFSLSFFFHLFIISFPRVLG